MKTGVLAAVLVATASMAFGAGQVLVGTNNSGAGTNYTGNQGNLSETTDGALSTFYSNIGWAQEFTLSQAAIANDISVFAQYGDVASTFSLEITDRIGPGTTGADILFAGNGTYGATRSWIDLSLNNLSLAAGNYFLVMTSNTAVPVVTTDPTNCPVQPVPGHSTLCFITGEWGAGATDISTAGHLDGLFVEVVGGAPDSTGPALTAFPTSGFGGALDFQLTSTATPEPATWFLLGGGALALGAKRRFVR